MRHHEAVRQFIESAGTVVLGKEPEFKLFLCCLFARGHLLIEDQPGVGKTTMVRTFAQLAGLNLSRIQFTNDLLPSDILGASIFDERERKFNFYEGPIFSPLVLADELNRGTPKTQSACLQAMEEGQISIDGQTYKLPRPFILVGTQNPRQSIGTYPLPESQLDRFLIKIRLGFPSRESEKKLLLGELHLDKISALTPVFDSEMINKIQDEVDGIHVSDPIVNYLQDILEESRKDNGGLSTRAALGWIRTAKAFAYIERRSYLIPEDIQTVGPAIMNHRLRANLDWDTGNMLALELLHKVPVR